ncbi:hypothetical protein ROP_31400 [Rhodococcus opacus B4]|uniref:Uncharacterized protein n=1 Tax=Rhodococcus opacus (strain B4) TaxID=632772 RepID=C1B6T4_RHOOB|nr:hypothetical protein ROP_31400 [Rhodococcus opacus B4]
MPTPGSVQCPHIRSRARQISGEPSPVVVVAVLLGDLADIPSEPGQLPHRRIPETAPDPPTGTAARGHPHPPPRCITSRIPQS